MQLYKYGFSKPAALLILLAFLTLTACGEGSSGAASAALPLSDVQKIAALEASGDIPKLDRSASIGGPDVNGNGVRDDVEAYITQKYPQADQRAAATQYAAAMQASLLVDKANNVAVKAVSLKSSRAINCVFQKFNPTNDPNSALPAVVVRELVSVTTNTKTRLAAYLAYSKALSGSVLSQPQGDTCE